MEIIKYENHGNHKTLQQNCGGLYFYWSKWAKQLQRLFLEAATGDAL